MPKIEYEVNGTLQVEEFAAVLKGSGIKRPVDDLPRLAEMLKHSNLWVTARCQGALVGVARSLSDFSYCCYLSDLAVLRGFQGQGVGARMMEVTREACGPRSNLLLLSANDAMDYYPKKGFERIDNAYLIKREY